MNGRERRGKRRIGMRICHVIGDSFGHIGDRCSYRSCGRSGMFGQGGWHCVSCGCGGQVNACIVGVEVVYVHVGK